MRDARIFCEEGIYCVSTIIGLDWWTGPVDSSSNFIEMHIH